MYVVFGIFFFTKFTPKTVQHQLCQRSETWVRCNVMVFETNSFPLVVFFYVSISVIICLTPFWPIGSFLLHFEESICIVGECPARLCLWIVLGYAFEMPYFENFIQYVTLFYGIFHLTGNPSSCDHSVSVSVITCLYLILHASSTETK